MRSLFILVLLSACDDSSSVTLRWSFPDGDCDAAGVQTVHVFIGPLAPRGSFDHELECAIGEQGVRLDGISSGSHVLVLKGLSRDVVLFSLQREVDVKGDLGTFVMEPYVAP